MKKNHRIAAALILTGILIFPHVSHAAWDGGPYDPNETLDPECTPAQTDCTVSLGFSAVGGNIGIGTSSPYAKLSVAGQVVGTYFTATSTTQASVFPYASTTGLTVSNTASTSNLIVSNAFTLGSLSGLLKATAGAVAAALVDLASDVTGILPVANGGTGWANVAAGSILYGNDSSALATTTAGTAGYVLAYLNGVPTWTATTTLSTISGVLDVSRGGTATSTQVTNGVNYFDGTRITSASSLVFDGSTFTAPRGAFSETSGTTTIASGQGFTIGSTQFVLQQGSGRVGIGKANPAVALDVSGAITGSGNLTIARALATGGSSSFPDYAFSHTAQGNSMGMFFAANNELGFSTNAVERLRITSAGNVGIGTTSPYAKLSVAGHILGEYFTATSSTASLFSGGFLSLASTTIGSGAQAGGLTIFGGATTTGNAYFAGNVGIGTTSPYAQLAVVGAVVADSYTATSTTATSTFGGGFVVDTTGLVYQKATGNLGLGTLAPNWGLQISRTSSSSIALTDSDASDYYRNIIMSRGNNDYFLNFSRSAGSAPNTYEPFLHMNAGVANFVFGRGVNTSLTGGSNTFIGYGAGASVTDGSQNNFIGQEAGRATTGGHTNTFIGVNSGYSNIDGSRNIFLGEDAGYSNVSGTYNTFFGVDAGYTNTGSYNLYLGEAAGHSATGGSYNVVLGRRVNPASLSGSQQLNIGNVLYGSGLYDGSSGFSSDPTAAGKIGIGTTTPWRTLSIVGNSELGTNALAGSFTATSSTATSSFAGGATFAVSGGNVGIGTIDTTAPLTVLKSVSAGALNIDFVNNAIHSVGNEVRLRLQTYTGQGSPANANYISSVDTNVGSGSNDMAFGVWGGGTLGLSEVLRLQGGTGNVGIGTSSPYAKLAVAGHILGSYYTATSSTASLFNGGLLSLASTTIGNGAQASGLTIFGGATTTGNAYVAGNIGINNASPSRKLDIIGGSNAGILLKQGAQSDATSGAFYNGLTFENVSTAHAYALGYNSGGTFALNYYNPTNSLYSNLLAVNGGLGNVGIGVDSPLYKLSFATTTTDTNYGPLVGFSNASNPRYTAGIGTSHLSGVGQSLDLYAGDSGGNATALGGSALRMTLTSGGNVGIGTSQPVYRLDLKNTATTPNAPMLAITDPDNNRYAAGIGFNSATRLSFYSGETAGNGTALGSTHERMVITTGGDVGIGTVTPQKKVHILGSDGAVSSFPATGAKDFLILENNGNANMNLIGSATGSSEYKFTKSGGVQLQGSVKYDYTNDFMGFYTGGTVVNYKMAITGTGNVGIGTTTPSNKFTVTGDVTPGGDYDSNGQLVVRGSTDPSKVLMFAVDTNSATNYAYIQSSQDGVAARPLLFNPIGGNIGISTTSPWRSLSVTGTVGFDGLTGAIGAGSLCLSADKEVVYNAGSDNCLSSLRATKHDITPLTVDMFSQALALQPVSFIYDNDASSTVRYGFIAEDTAAVDPHLVTYDAKGALSGVDDRSVIAIIVGAFKSLAERVMALEDTLRDMAQSFTSEEVRTNRLCVGDVCVTEAEFLALLQKNQIAAPAPAASPDPAPAPSPAEEPAAEPAVEPADEPADAPAPEPVPEPAPADIPAENPAAEPSLE